MSEDKQITWFYRRHEKELHDIVWIAPVAKFKDYRLADLAFRIRDEVMQNSYLYDSMIDVQQHIEGPTERRQDFVFWSMRAKPIHWIIAALIAKEQK